MMFKQKGFTVVELIIVIVVIAVLIALTLLGFNGVRSRTQEVSVQNDMKNISKQVEVFRLDRGRYPAASTLQELGIKVNKSTYGVNPTGATIFYCVDSAGAVYSIVARVKSTKLLQYLSSTGEITTYSGSGTAPQLCLDSGVPGTTSNVTYTGFTEDGAWFPWVQQ